MTKPLDSHAVPVNDAARILAGDRRALARAITLVESTRPADQAAAEALLTTLLPDTGRAMRIGISGAPGVGKSTFIESFGKFLTGIGKRVAVFAIDPSSRRSGGSILGDKTRMEQLSRDPDAYIRPSPAGTTLGGVARRTRESMLLAEAAGFDVVIVETVGVGQSETAVADMTDLFVLLASPGGGDDLQGIKRGVMELADLVIVTKSDGDLAAAAGRAASDYHAALHLMRPKHEGLPPQVLKVSSVEGRGIGEAWDAMARFHGTLTGDGRLDGLRAEQARRWFWSEVQTILSETILSDAALARTATTLERRVAGGETLPYSAARDLIRSFRS
ncbi:MAG: methylmalonyl Co-A mutase-associated GTPase MeaB [Proteobacteria bacterium]|nr:methylmalonyl Co-A mutase-associated GTPase MeaB [Pseudomonadota bacterium]